MTQSQKAGAALLWKPPAFSAAVGIQTVKMQFHSLRHTHATKLIESGISPKAVQARLGHEKIETTLQTYVHHTDHMERDAVDAFEDIMSFMAN